MLRRGLRNYVSPSSVSRTAPRRRTRAMRRQSARGVANLANASKPIARDADCLRFLRVKRGRAKSRLADRDPRSVSDRNAGAHSCADEPALQRIAGCSARKNLGEALSDPQPLSQEPMPQSRRPIPPSATTKSSPSPSPSAVTSRRRPPATDAWRSTSRSRRALTPEDADADEGPTVKHFGLYPVASLEDRRIAAIIDAVCLLFAYGGFMALFSSLGGQFTATKLNAARVRGDLRRRLSAILRAVHDLWRHDAGHDVSRIAGSQLLGRASDAAAIFAPQPRIRLVGIRRIRGIRVVVVG